MSIITGKTKLLGIIGHPVEHSLSPVMQNAEIKRLGVDYIYIPFPVKPENLETALDGFATIGVMGFNATIPHKQAIIPLLSEVTTTAKLVGAVNTVWRTEIGWKGTNTDVIGFVTPLKALNRDWNTIKPIILGNGGAARAVVVGLAELGCRDICVVGRDKDKLGQFKQSWDTSELQASITVHSWDELSGMVSESQLIVNTTPIGMFPHTQNSPVDSNLWEKLPNNAIAYDLIYNPSPTQFLKDAKQQGLTVIDGLDMLVYQGAAALEIWLQQPVSATVMSEALKQSLFS
ncbi:shikimate 5-dehydrogenase [Crocosphaera subtropica ATCC 51142]|uniref:Shikimate dehydrogenase (NADP(+)) n=1 Tax=Crocosphaera subtropica (strain ATCC 51142 / BH68) TaxID=43989 RepID=AROE_CROS5|nr:shikimate dehydrogenase [Crocosphaera subtropica]B1WUG7.1 RecName: Full=Shikimate dehydrogenase (NADP(+)); Short=SDH [Crocosphaera subtropica ATCC 51142]ACB53821.1 shikimate 5-dehydrogenase [Crocosphaera subtropica ATCC 51142]